MANQLKMAVVHAILTLAGLGWSQRRIAGVLGVDRETVARYVHSPPADSKPATNPIPGSPAAEAPLADKSSGPESLCEPFRAVIEAKLGQGLTGQRIYQDLVEGHGFTASYSSVRRFLQRLSQSQPLPFRRLEVLPGEQAQVDFGVGAPVLRPDDKRRRPHVFRVVLSFSRKAYSEVVYHQTTENFLRYLENAFWHFGGVTQTTVIDNLKAAVSRADWYDPDLHPKIQSFCQHYGCLLLLLIRWILSRIPQTRESQLCAQISLLTDPLPQWLGRQLQRVHHENLPASVEWIALIVLLVVIKHILITVVIALN